jgi:DNA recombination protein RmuC
MLTAISCVLLGLAIGAFAGAFFGFRFGSKTQSTLVSEKNSINEALANEQKNSIELKTNITNLMTQIGTLQSQVTTSNQAINTVKDRFETQLETMKVDQSNLLEKTTKLSEALSNSQGRGKYGEAQLENLLQNAGLIEDVDYTRQKADEASGGKPDIKIIMPGGLNIFIDSKFPFAKYDEAIIEKDPATRANLMKAHAADLRKHIDELAKRKYDVAPGSANFVVVFAPFESILAEALIADPKLLNDAFAKKVVVAPPSNILALLRTIKMGFEQSALAKNAEEIKVTAVKLADKLISMHDSITSVGMKLGSTLKAYNTLIGTVGTAISPELKKMMAQGLPNKVVPKLGLVSDNVRRIGGKEPLFLGEDEIYDGEEINNKREISNTGND